jgi:hypothetical protein
VIFIRPQKFVVVVLCYGSVDKMVSYLIGGVMVSMLALSVLDPWDREVSGKTCHSTRAH